MTTTLIAVESVVLVLLTVLVAGLLRSHAEILKRLHALGAGIVDDDGSSITRPLSTLPRPADGFVAVADIDGMGLRDDAMHVSIVGTRHRTLLAFLTSGCITCRAFWDAFADLGALDLPADLRVVVVTKDTTDDSISALRRLAPPHLTVVMANTAWEAYAVPGSPYFVLVDGPSGRVRGEGTGTSWDQVWNLLTQAGDDSREQRIDRELLAHGVAPGDTSLYRTAEQIGGGHA